MKGRDPYVIHYVHDMDRAKRFYMEVFGVEPSFASEGWTTLDFGSFQLALHTAGEEGPLPYAGLVLEVDSIEEIQADVDASGGACSSSWSRGRACRSESAVSGIAKGMDSTCGSSREKNSIR